MKKKSSRSYSSCELPLPGKVPGGSNKSALYRHRKDCSWRGIRDEPYKAAGAEWSGVLRRVLIGSHGETAKFHVRYFEIAPGGWSSFERHRHEHVVICVRGKGVVRIENSRKRMGYMDVAYIAPDAPHQLSNPHTEPFGFLCIVNAKRDRPRLLP